MKPVIKTSAQLLKEGLISEYEMRKLPSHWENTTALIFTNRDAAVEFAQAVLVPRVGKDVLAGIWSSLTGPPREFDPISDAIRGYSGPDPNKEVWLLFRTEDFQSLIQPTLV